MLVSQYLSNPSSEHCEAVKWIIRYLRGTSNMCLCFDSSKPILEIYSGTDIARDVDSRQDSHLLLQGELCHGVSKLQKCVTISTIEVEYIVVTQAGKEMLWLKRFLQEL